jgi:glutaredoxin 3
MTKKKKILIFRSALYNEVFVINQEIDYPDTMQKEVIIYTTSYCPYCRAAKALLETKGVTFTEIDVEGNNEKRHWLAEVTGRKTVPQIFIDNKPYGGFDDISKLDEEEQLDSILGIDQK